MKDLHVPPGPGLPHGLVVPTTELNETFSRSSGPGGQSVNTSDSRVQLSFDLRATDALNEAQRRRALGNLRGRLVDGQLVVAASGHRSQHRNRTAARERLATLLRDALAPPPPPRRATRPTLGSQRRRLAAKKRRGAIKTMRGRVED